MLAIVFGRRSYTFCVRRIFIYALVLVTVAPALSQSPQRRVSPQEMFTPAANSLSVSFDLLNLQPTDNAQLARAGTPVEITAIRARLLNGAAPGDEFGNSVAFAGDVTVTASTISSSVRAKTALATPAVAVLTFISVAHAMI